MSEQPVRRIILVPAAERNSGTVVRPGVRRFALARPGVAFGPELLPKAPTPLAGVRAP
jgi:hypothetical protein